MQQHSTELLRFISGIQITNDGIIHMNDLGEDRYRFKSDLYEPQFSLSILAINTQTLIQDGDIEQVNEPVEPHTLTGRVLSSDLSRTNPDAYLLTRLVTLEAFALVYNITMHPSNLQYISNKDFTRLKENIQYLADYLSTEPKYYSMIEALRDMYISVGYIEHQVDVIIGNREGREW